MLKHFLATLILSNFSFTRKLPCVCSSVGAELLLKVINLIKIMIYQDIFTCAWKVQIIGTNIRQRYVCIIYIIIIWCSASYITIQNIKTSHQLFRKSICVDPDKNTFVTPPYCLHLKTMCFFYISLVIVDLIDIPLAVWEIVYA